jgi:hypothetical protein
MTLYLFKIYITKDLPGLAEGVLMVMRKAGAMNNETFFANAACSEYESLLNQCEAALDIWHQRHREICEAHLTGKEIGGKLLRLQADYAKAYSLLRKHINRCALCQFVSSLDKSQSPPQRAERESY